MKKFLPKVILVFILFIIFFVSPNKIFAASAGPIPSDPGWTEDPNITEIGKNAERSRQLFYWVFTHPPVNQAPIISKMWSVSRNISYAFILLAVAILGLQYILSKRKISSQIFNIPLGNNINFVAVFGKIAGSLLLISFSYLIVLGLIQVGEISTRFSIEKLGACNLFNINYTSTTVSCVLPGEPGYDTFVSGLNNNYQNFKGFINLGTKSENLESINTSIFLVKLTTFTFNLLSIIFLFRHILLLFLLILSPFIGLLIFFAFFRRVAWVWIGTFVKFLFYGPLLALFLSAVANIYKAGIPYFFDFRGITATPALVVYPTAINILYGGPAQTILGFNNSSNYVDTYAEYIISLLLLWAAIILPWFLLNVLKDYCCDILKQNQATLSLILDRLRDAFPQPTLPSESSAISLKTGISRALPFRQKIITPQQISTEELMRKLQTNQAGSVQTYSLAKAMDLHVSSIKDLAAIETDKKKLTNIKASLQRIANPSVITEPGNKTAYSNLHSELVSRAEKGDKAARRIVNATLPMEVQLIKTAPQLSSQLKIVGLPQKAPSSQDKAVAIEDYEEVKKMWVNHYRNSDVPITDKIKNRQEWLRQDIEKLTNTVDLLSSPREPNRQQGMKSVAEILPFVMLGEFSNSETVAYCKAKMEAAKQIRQELETGIVQPEEPENVLIANKTNHQEQPKTMQTEEIKTISENKPISEQ